MYVIVSPSSPSSLYSRRLQLVASSGNNFMQMIPATSEPNRDPIVLSKCDSNSFKVTSPCTYDKATTAAGLKVQPSPRPLPIEAPTISNATGTDNQYFEILFTTKSSGMEMTKMQ